MPVIHENRMAHEPPHVHANSAGGSAVFWLMPVSLRAAYGYTPPHVALIRRIVSANRDLLLRRWDEFFDEDHNDA